MGIFSRFADIMSANINDLLDRAESPEKMAKQYLRQAMEDLAEVKQETASIIAEEKRCQRLHEAATAKVQKYHSLAQKAVSSGNDNDARVFLVEKKKAEENAATTKAAYDAAKANAEKMRQLYTKLANDVNTLQSRLKNVQAMAAVADAQDTVSRMTSKDYGSGIAKFDQMEERIRAKLDESSANMELSSAPTNEADALAAKYAGTGQDVDSDLAALKAEMGIAPATDVDVEAELAEMKKDAEA